MSNTNLPTMPIFGVDPHAPQISLDGESITLELIGPNKVRVPLLFRRDALAFFVSRLTRAHLLAEAVAQSRNAPAEMPIVQLDRAHAQSDGAPFVVMTVVTHLPMIQHFEISPGQAEDLAQELVDSAERARMADKSRH